MGGTVSGGTAVWARGVSTDSRTLRRGDAFFALRGPRFDGHDYVGQARKLGAAFAVVERGRSRGLAGMVVEVDDTLEALGRLAADWRLRFPVKVAAITGSVGKSTTKEMAAAVLTAGGKVLKNEGNLNNRIGLPQTLFRLNRSHALAVLEMGCNAPGEIAKLTALARPDAGLITRVAPVHLAGLHSLAGVARAKAELIRGLGPGATCVLNLDDELIRREAKSWKGKTIGFSLRPDAEFRGRLFRLLGVSKEVVAGKPRIRFWIQDKKPGRNEGALAEFSLVTLSPHNAANALAATALGAAFGIGLETAAERLRGFFELPGRGEVVRSGRGAFIVNDYYNASPVSVTEALSTLAWWKGPMRGVAVLGEMAELGRYADKYHRQVGANAARAGMDLLVTVGPHAALMAEAAARAGLRQDAVFVARDNRQAAAILNRELRPGDWVLIKGSRVMGLETVAAAIE
jgi:UDP-N-acetylmuramoyl-tripeptide--D-alanyl-D-alanine ligase